MEEPEVPLEEVHEHIHHHATGHGHEHDHGQAHGMGKPAAERWTMGVALSTALFAALAAIASLIAGGQANEAMISQIESADVWNYYQAKSIKLNLLESKMELLLALGHEATVQDLAKRKEYEATKEEKMSEAKAKEVEAHQLLKNHETMATAVTMFQVAIALGAIAVLTKLRLFWFISMGLGLLGALSFSSGLITISTGKHPSGQSEGLPGGHSDGHKPSTAASALAEAAKRETEAPAHAQSPAEPTSVPSVVHPAEVTR
jgi:hypothetical protein